MVTDPTLGFVLVHGSELGAWLWDRTLPLLPHAAVAVDLPGRGRRPAPPRSVTFDDAVAAIVADAETLGVDRIVLVAHSFSGVLVPPVVARLGHRVAAAVLVGANVPVAGAAWVDDLPLPQRLLLRAMYRLRPDGLLSPAEQNRTALCNDLDETTTEEVVTRRVREPPGPLLAPVPTAALPAGLPRHYVRLNDDRTTSPVAQQRSIDRLGDVQVHELGSGHLPMLSRPAELAAILARVARSLEPPEPGSGAGGAVAAG